MTLADIFALQRTANDLGAALLAHAHCPAVSARLIHAAPFVPVIMLAAMAAKLPPARSYAPPKRKR